MEKRVITEPDPRIRPSEKLAAVLIKQWDEDTVDVYTKINPDQDYAIIEYDKSKPYKKDENVISRNHAIKGEALREAFALKKGWNDYARGVLADAKDGKVHPVLNRESKRAVNTEITGNPNVSYFDLEDGPQKDAIMKRIKDVILLLKGYTDNMDLSMAPELNKDKATLQLLASETPGMPKSEQTLTVNTNERITSSADELAAALQRGFTASSQDNASAEPSLASIPSKPGKIQRG